MTESVDQDIDALLGELEPDPVPVPKAFVEPSFLPLADINRMWGLSSPDLETLRNNPRRVAMDIVRMFLANRTPITLWGPVGARKTRSIEGFGDEVDENGTPYQVITIQPSTEDPTSIHGLMYTTLDPDTGETIMKRSVPEVAKRVMKYWEEKRGLTVMFLDEMTTCMPAQQHALLGILTHGKYGDLDISKYITIAMAANPEDTVSTVNPLGEQVINRGGHIAWYGDAKLFIEDWSSGFGSPSRKPDDVTQWYVSQLLQQDMERAFRGNWEIDNLVPYELIEHTERSTTEASRMIKLINRLFADSPDHVRHFYLVEAVRALQGNKWADNMATVCSLESTRYSETDVMNTVERVGVQCDWTYDQLVEKLGKSVHMSGNKIIGTDKVSSIAAGLLEKATAEPFNYAAYLSLWVFAITSPNEGVKMSMHAALVKLLIRGMEQKNKGAITTDQTRPKFIDRETLTTVINAIKSQSEAAPSETVIT